jgi:hypothetical protein
MSEKPGRAEEGSLGTMLATGWHNGGTPEDAAGYGLKFSKEDRDRYFDPEWSSVLIECEGGEVVEAPLSASFWRSCSEVRSAALGSWMLQASAAPWVRQSPPSIVVTPIEGRRFSARILKRHLLR